MIVCSLNEIEHYGRRAARGAGMPWGLAEEAGRAARWLTERGLPGVELLAHLLAANDGRAYRSMAPVLAGARWRAPAGALCPVCTGAALSDRMAALAGRGELDVDALACPLLLVPFLDGTVCELRWPGVRATLTARGLSLACDAGALPGASSAVAVNLVAGEPCRGEVTHPPRGGGVGTPAAAWRVIDRFARRTYVPASEESRARGAGGNDDD